MDEPADKPSPMTVVEAGRRGGHAMAAKHGTEYYARIGKAGGEATKAANANDPDHYTKLGKMGGGKGGRATADKYGHEFYEAIGSKGGKRVKELIEAGKAALAREAEDGA